jgi:hypothetical protein
MDDLLATEVPEFCDRSHYNIPDLKRETRSLTLGENLDSEQAVIAIPGRERSPSRALARLGAKRLWIILSACFDHGEWVADLSTRRATDMSD